MTAPLTTYSRAEDRVNLLNAGFDLYVPKPIEPSQLVTAAMTLARLGGRSAAGG